MNVYSDNLWLNNYTFRMQPTTLPFTTANATQADVSTQEKTTPHQPTSKCLREASEYKARKLHFYQNGRPYDTRLTVSVIPGKEFVALPQLYQFLTEKTQLLNGVQYIFTVNGELITSLEELEHDQTYIVSGSKNFIPFPYGSTKPNPARLPNNASRYRSTREDDLRLIRPLSSKYNNVYSASPTHQPHGSLTSIHNHCNGGYYYYGSNIPPSRDIRQVTIINNKNHDIYAKIMLNLKSPKSFDLLLADLGDAVQMKAPKIMFTCNGQMVKSVSHLKHELGHINLFYIDNEYPHEALWLYEELYQGAHLGPIWSQTPNDCQHCDGFPFSPVNIDPVMQEPTQQQQSKPPSPLPPAPPPLPPTTTPTTSQCPTSINIQPTPNFSSQNLISKFDQNSCKDVQSSIPVPGPPSIPIPPPPTLPPFQNSPKTTRADINRRQSSFYNSQRLSTINSAKSSELRSSQTFVASQSPITNNNNNIQVSPVSIRHPTITTNFVDKPPPKKTDQDFMEPLQISTEKYEQIQAYVEKLLNETSFQILNEGLLKQPSPEPLYEPGQRKPTNKSISNKKTSTVAAGAKPSNRLSPPRKPNQTMLSNSFGSSNSIAVRRPSKKFTKDLTHKNTTTSKSHSQLPTRKFEGSKPNLNRMPSDLNSSRLSINKQNRTHSKKQLSKSSDRIMANNDVNDDHLPKFLSKSNERINLEVPSRSPSTSSLGYISKSTDKLTVESPRQNKVKQFHSTTHLNEKSSAKPLRGKKQNLSNENLQPKTVPSKLSPTMQRKKTSSYTNLHSKLPINQQQTTGSNSSLNKLPGMKKAQSNESLTGSQKGLSKLTAAQKYQQELNTKSKLKDIEKHLHGIHCPPPFHLSLERIFGYNGRKLRNLVYLNSGELAFYSGIYAILWNHTTGTQRFYMEHENDICCLRVDPTCECIATGHLTSTAMIIRIWSIKTLKTLKILTTKKEFVDMEFTKSNTLFILTGGKESNLSLWNWRLKVNMSNTSKTLDHNEQVYGLTVHPLESDIVVTYGKMHLVVWHFKKDRTIECRTALQMQSKIAKTIHCAEFLNDNSLLTGDSIGNLTIWAPFEVNKVLEFAIKEVKGHESQLTCFKLTKENILISGDKDGAIKTWDVNDNEFRLLNAVKLPATSGPVTSITLPNKLAETIAIFVGTANSFILKGSALQTEDYQIIFEGHFMAVRTISIDLRNNIYTASLDRKICKWNEYGMIWKTDSNVQGMSSTVHPNGQVLAVGSASGIVIIVNTASGEALQYIQLTNVCIGCMSYAPNGNFLVAGCQDGSLHVIPVADNGKKYDKVSVLKGPLPILTLQWSMDTQFILTSVDDNNFQELILWDLPNTRYIRNVTSFSDNLQWYNVTCSGLEDARGTWDNEKFKDVVNICKNYSPNNRCIVTGDENGYVRLFAYPSFDTRQSYFQYRQGGGSVTDVKFSQRTEQFVVSANFEGSIFFWRMMEYNPPTTRRNSSSGEEKDSSSSSTTNLKKKTTKPTNRAKKM